MDSRRILIKNGTVITMDNAIGDFAPADVLVHGAMIEAVGPNLRQPDAEIIDATGMVVLPGLIDTHRHTWQAALRSPLTSAAGIPASPSTGSSGVPGAASACPALPRLPWRTCLSRSRRCIKDALARLWLIDETSAYIKRHPLRRGDQ
jgi:imidazolonepropionase-like amidohydrolase